MALTIANVVYNTAGNMVEVTGTVALDSSYVRGGESLTAANLGLSTLNSVKVFSRNGFFFDYDYTNFKIMVYYGAGGTLVVNTTKVGNVTTGEDVLQQFTLKGNTLSADNMGVRVIQTGTIANNANTKTIKAKLGTTDVCTTAMTASQLSPWRLVYDVIRTGAATQQVSAHMSQGGSTQIDDIELSEPTEDLTADLILGCTGESNSATNDIVSELLIVEPILPAGTGAVGFEVMDTQSLAGLTGVRFEAVGW